MADETPLAEAERRVPDATRWHVVPPREPEQVDMIGIEGAKGAPDERLHQKADARIGLNRDDRFVAMRLQRADALSKPSAAERAIQEGVHAVIERALDVATRDAVARAERDRRDG